MTRRVVCSANKLSDGTLIIGVRHWDQFMTSQAHRIMSTRKMDDEVSLVKDHKQGFIDQWGEYMDREEAWEVAEAAGQIVRSGPGFSGPELYSENLY